MYAIEYKADSCSVCNMVERNLRECNIKVKLVDKSKATQKIHSTPYTEFYTDSGTFIDHRIGFISVSDILHIKNVYDK